MVIHMDVLGEFITIRNDIRVYDIQTELISAEDHRNVMCTSRGEFVVVIEKAQALSYS